ncbi:hypothetical protein ACFLZ2_00645 [Candidatus Margulisiibacteriota bacterium]
MRNNLILGLLFVFILSTVSYAARPLATEDSGTVSVGEWEVETGLESEIDNTSSVTNTLGIAFKTGINDSLDLGAEISSPSVDGEGGPGTTALKIKYRFNDETDTLPSFAVGATVAGQPNNQDSVTTITAIATKNLNDLALHINLGSTSTGNTSETGYSGAIEYPVNDIITVVGEIVGASASGTSQLDALIGGRISITENMTIDGGFNINMSDNSPASKYTIGLTTIL